MDTKSRFLVVFLVGLFFMIGLVAWQFVPEDQVLAQSVVDERNTTLVPLSEINAARQHAGLPPIDPANPPAGMRVVEGNYVEISLEMPTPSYHDNFTKMDVESVSVVEQDQTAIFLAPESTLGGFLGVNFDTNPIYNGGLYFIPPDPIAAAGPNQLVSVVNTMVAWYNKNGTSPNITSLSTFFSSLSPLTSTFDPKVLYDQHLGRFVIISLERTTSPQTSRMFLAVSDDSDPNGTWYYQQINSLLNIGGVNCWADYPGFAVGDNAIYITANMYDFSNTYCGVRLWIVDKGFGGGGLYDGGTSTFTVHDPPTAAGGGVATTTQPAHTFGTLPGNTGTYLVQYSGLSAAPNEFLGVFRVDDPLGTPTFSHQFVLLGDIDTNSAGLLDAPQLGTTTNIEVNDRRSLNAVWRNNSLYMATTVESNAAPDLGQTTAYWVELDTTTPAALSVNQQGPVGAEDLGTGTFTFFPSVMVDDVGNIGLGFSASGSSIYPGAYATRHHVADPAGTVRGTETIQAGLDFYIRIFPGDTRNRWGDYSGIALDPADGTFWAYNEYAMLQGTPGVGTGNGRWGTAFGNFSILDYGDAPDMPYPTLLASDGARHIMDGVTFLGASVDEDPDGQPNASATGDDADGNDDEDGVIFTSPLAVGQPATVDVIASTSGPLNAWVDFNADGDWADAGEQIFVDLPLAAGLNNLNFTVPATAVSGSTTFARFRFSTQPGLLPTGLAPNGEVEDYFVEIFEADLGDAPDPTYPTLVSSNGASHVLGMGPWLGASVDMEPDGQPNATATGDDADGNDDEDGVTFTSLVVVGETANVTVVATGPGLLNAWVDFNVDGDWMDAGEQIFVDMPLVPGPNNLPFPVPATAVPTSLTFARFRFSTLAGLLPTGLAPDGEVEDYALEINGVDFGDASDPSYPTLRASNGARHVLSTGPWLGVSVDHDADGQPTAMADGDDIDGNDDEDGVLFTTPLVQGLTANLVVTATATGLLDAWLDFNADGDWMDAGEQIFTTQNLVAGSNNLNFAVPASAVIGNTYARFRFSTGGGLSYSGLALDGEVEDYMVIIQAPNTPPVAAADSYTTTEDIPLVVAAPGVLSNDTDADGDTLSAIPDSSPTHGVLSLQVDGSFAYTPTLNYNGGDSFTYHANDGLADSNIVTVTLTIVPDNDPPVAVADSYTTTEDTTLSVPAISGVLANDTDIDGDPLTAVLDNDVLSGTLMLDVDGSFVYTPTLNFCGADSFTYHANDGQDDSNIASVTLNVVCVNDAPIAVDDFGIDFTTSEDLSFTTGNLLTNDYDPEGQVLSVFSYDDSGLLGVLTNNGDGSFDYDPDKQFEVLLPGEQAYEIFSYVVSDGVLTDTATVTITIQGANDDPLIDAGPDQTVAEGELVQFQGSASDPGLRLPEAIVDMYWDFGDGNTATGVLTPTHTFVDDDVYTVTLTVTDTHGGVSSDWLLITVENVSPTLSDIPDQEGYVGEAITITGAITDPGLLDSQAVVITWVDGVTETLQLGVTERQFTATHTYTEAGEYTIIVRVTDKDGGWDQQEFTATISVRGYWIYLPVTTR